MAIYYVFCPLVSYTTERLTLNWILQGGTGVYLHGISDPNFDYQINSFTSNDTFLDIGPASDPSMIGHTYTM